MKIIIDKMNFNEGVEKVIFVDELGRIICDTPMNNSMEKGG